MALAVLFPPDRPLRLASGERLGPVQVAYETYGRLNGAGDNAVFLCHALTGDSHPARHRADDTPGWWETMVGPGRPVDTDRYFVICANVLGGCAGTTGPWTAGADGHPHGWGFPDITVADMVTVHRELVSALGVRRLRAVVGGSLGGMQALEWLLRHPDDADGFAIIAGTGRQSADNLAWNAVARYAIRNSAALSPGPAAEADSGAGLGTARMIAHLTYLSEQSLHRKFGRAPRREGTRTHASTTVQGDFAVESYLEHQADKFLRRFDPRSYLHLLGAMDRFDAFAVPDRLRQAAVLPEVLLYSFAHDRLFGPEHSARIQTELAARGLAARHEQDRTTDIGHDAFLLEVPGFLDVADRFLQGLDTCPRALCDDLVSR
ncbi:homoserine O-acetyltransferase [Streptomyces sp. S.PNR 29]|uniref:homoserine O-acetyltransferase MetX n=1 Tax=Streptomyces sp. S.PNR 29 TaxID=2973805 RepID=UPI0025B1DA67|nr:homoserine O-acetyltransferase [Streptomyces sp. S.PNR 29]MDN0200485.1 homoserine O-acetyltransferase [Streptomyces sp. S.PNR 29]